MFTSGSFCCLEIALKLHNCCRLKDYFCSGWRFLFFGAFLYLWPLLFNTPCLVKVNLVVAPHCGFWCTIENAGRSAVMYKYFPDAVTNTERPNNHDEIYGFLWIHLHFPPLSKEFSLPALPKKSDKSNSLYLNISQQIAWNNTTVIVLASHQATVHSGRLSTTNQCQGLAWKD